MKENQIKSKKYEVPKIEVLEIDFNTSIAVSGYGIGKWEES